MAQYPQDWYDARDWIVNYVGEDLLGPEEGSLSSPPLTRILVGILYPQKDDESLTSDHVHAVPVPNLKGKDAQNASDDADESNVSMANRAFPSSMGLTFAVAQHSNTSSILIYPEAIRYRREGVEDSAIWNPERIRPEEALELSVQSPGVFHHDVPGSDEKLEVVTVVRAPLDGRRRITVTLVNKFTNADFSGLKDEYCWFRPQFTVRTNQGFFVDGSPTSRYTPADEEIESLNFLYRGSKNLAQGHGCSPVWSEKSNQVSELSTAYLPRQEVALSSAEAGKGNDLYGTYDLNMGKLASLEGRKQLLALADAYENWIADKNSSLRSETGLSASNVKAGESNLAEAEQCLSRIRKGIQTLDEPQVSRAFELMNLAMIRQRDAQDTARGHKGLGSPGRNTPYQTNQKWRPFQIAFILMNIPGLSSTDHEDRKIADLLWFPTGGGKTEAYLGCIAFSALLRRIRNPHDGGVSSIMRYTLRILTTDQFMRAAGLICALESIRREMLPNTSEPISLGLWVGDKTSFNRIEDARKEHNRLKNHALAPEDSTLLQVKNCPVCNSKLTYKNYHFDSTGLEIRCSNLNCEFVDGLPLYIIDDDVYRHRPALVIGTVDKFAQMTWKSEVAWLLSLDGKFSSPDLIVQDELHLISGPLGTMVGLYESALDLALERTGTGKPKVIASTATIRRADEQVQAVFDRQSSQFPPAGLDPSDNYFSKSASRDVTGTREYVGVVAPGTSQSTLLVRLYASLLQGVYSLEAPDEVKDSYWTLLGYFNSLRVLGSAYLQAVDDIPRRMEVIAKRRGEKKRGNNGQPPLELTSRASSGEILSTRQQMGESYPAPRSPSIVLATNMISVGLDIDRLGLMVVAGQPQNTSEYIQATSRVGRRFPGLVFVAFNGQRSRDVSHFESFIPFHRSLYRSVEATTTTPFSARARDRGAHGVLVAGIRLAIEELRADESASAVEDFRQVILDKVISPLEDRARRVSEEDAAPFRQRLEELLDSWSTSAAEERTKLYGTMNPYLKPEEASEVLLQPAGNQSGFDQFEASGIPWQTLTSLRDVDAETELFDINARKK